jgi:hypothetical protein
MNNEKGLLANNKGSNSVRTSGINQLSSLISETKNNIQVGRVTDIILNKDYPKIEKYGGLNAIGTIFFSKVDFQSVGSNEAKPFFPQISSYPLINELVLIFQLSDTSIGINSSETSYYYINSINLWNAPHHNGYPDLFDGINDEKQIEDYKKTSIPGGEIRRVNDNSTEIDFNSPSNPTQNTFIERSNIHPLQPFTGDNIYQGRWGNSLRFGSTTRADSDNELNNWSSEGENGEPITILRNGQPIDASKEGWVPIIENINKDLSSVYLTSNQIIPLNTKNEIYNSYTQNDNEVPTPVKDYNKNQVIINSGRLVFNSNEDHILLNSQRTISFNAPKGFNFDTKSNFVIDVGTSIKLGNKDAKESLILGDTFLENLNHFITGIEYLCIALQGSLWWPIGIPIPNGVESTPASELLARAKMFKSKVSQFKSKTSKTI